jgi:hypothetical protein
MSPTNAVFLTTYEKNRLKGRHLRFTRSIWVRIAGLLMAAAWPVRLRCLAELVAEPCIPGDCWDRREVR